MSCVLSTGFTLDCRRSIGGVDVIYFTELENVDTYTDASGVISALTLNSGKYFYKYEVRKASSAGKADIAGDVAVGSGFITHGLEVQLDSFSVAKRNEIRLLAQKPLIGIAKDANGLLSVYGFYRGLDLISGTGGTGKAAADLNGFNLVFQGEELDYPKGISQAIVDSLLAP